MTAVSGPTVGRLPDEALDVVGDVHGELGALDSLLHHLGYDASGRHPRRRRLVFVGDLCDRGPDSPGVVRRVRELVRAERATCVLGNHELNLLRSAEKDGNGWFFEHDHDRRRGRYTQSRAASGDGERAAMQEFFASLPVALEREDVRIVHAAWHESSLTQLREQHADVPVLEVYREYARRAERAANESGVEQEAQREYREFAAQLTDPDSRPPLLNAIGTQDANFQMSNPLRVLTSGVESLADAPFFASGKWRMVERVPWWRDYAAPSPVIVGHYWRPYDPAANTHARGEPSLFEGIGPDEWLGAKRRVYCVDFAVGGRFREREAGLTAGFRTRLAAFRWPERDVVFDDGEVLRADGGG